MAKKPVPKKTAAKSGKVPAKKTAKKVAKVSAENESKVTSMTVTTSEPRKLTDREKAQNITPEQEAMLSEYKARYELIAQSTDPIDLKKTVMGVLEAYKAANLPAPKDAIITLSPLHGLKYTAAMKFTEEKLSAALTALTERLQAYLTTAENKIRGWLPSAGFWEKVEARVALKAKALWEDNTEIRENGVQEFFSRRNRQMQMDGLNIIIAPSPDEVFSSAVAELGVVAGDMIGSLYPLASQRMMTEHLPIMLEQLQAKPPIPQPRSIAANARIVEVPAERAADDSSAA